jgi:two-component system cell cycle sensor histidine kinase/response regulator CckA
MGTDRGDGAVAGEGSASAVPDPLSRHLTDGLVLVDADGRVRGLNPAAADLLGASSRGTSAPLGARFTEVAPEDLADAIERRHAADLRAGTTVEFETYAPAPQDLWRRVRAHPTGDGQVVVQIEDVTAARRVAEHLHREARLVAAGELAGGVAHELNNLLTAIRGHGELLELVVAGEEARGDLDAIRTSAEQASSLADQLLAFSRRQLLRPSAVELGVALADAVPDLRARLGAGIAVALDVDDDLPAVAIDPAQLTRVLELAVDEAAQRLSAGDTITLRATERRVGTQDPTGSGHQLPQGTYVELRIHDDGAPLDAATASRAFEPYSGTPAAARRRGLGLAVVHGIVAQSGGTSRLRSAPDAGTVLSVLLPAATTGDVGGRPTGTTTGADVVGTVDVLLVDDDPGVRRFALRVLRRAGLEVIDAIDGPSALALLERGHLPRVLVTDVVMPGMTGDELAARVISRHPDVGVVLLSGYAEVALVGPGAPTATASFLAKPFSTDDLVGAVRALLRD